MPQHVIAPDEASSDMAACAAYLIENISKLDAKTTATEALVGHFLAGDEVDRAADYADALEDPFARDRLLIRVIEKCIDLNDDEYAFQLADAIEDTGLKANSLEAAALRLAARKDFELALKTSALLDHAADTIGGIAVQQALAGSIEAARHTIQNIDYLKSRVNARVELAAIERQNSNPEAAREWLEKAGEESNEIEFPEDRIRALNEIANGYLELEDHDSALDFFKRAGESAFTLESVHKDSFLVASAIGILRCGNMEIADETLDRVSDKTQVAACLYGFSRVFEADEVEDAVEAIEEAYAILKSQSEYEIRSTQSRNEMFGAIAVQFERVGMSQRAYEIAHENEDEGVRNRTLTSIAQLMVMDGRTVEAENIINGIEPESARVHACIGISDAANTVGNKELAIGYLKDAAELCVEVEQHIARAQISDQIALRLFEYGAIDDAETLARNNLALVADIRDEGSQVVALVALAAVYKKLGIEPDENDKSMLQTIARKSDW